MAIFYFNKLDNWHGYYSRRKLFKGGNYSRKYGIHDKNDKKTQVEFVWFPIDK